MSENSASIKLLFISWEVLCLSSCLFLNQYIASGWNRIPLFSLLHIEHGHLFSLWLFLELVLYVYFSFGFIFCTSSRSLISLNKSFVVLVSLYLFCLLCSFVNLWRWAWWVFVGLWIYLFITVIFLCFNAYSKIYPCLYL